MFCGVMLPDWNFLDPMISGMSGAQKEKAKAYNRGVKQKGQCPASFSSNPN